MNKRCFLAAWAGMVVMTALLASPVQADPLYVKGTGLGVSSLLFMGPHYFSAFAGQIAVDRGVAGPSDDFYVYCVDATRSRTSIEDVTVRPLSGLPDAGNPSNVQPDAGDRVAWLLNSYARTAWLSTDGNNRAAALQLAIWEVLYDPFGSYDISTGTFKLLYTASYPALVSYTTDYLAALGDNRAEAIWYDVTDPNVQGQDFAQPIPNPEPGTIVLFGSGLLGLVKIVRRRHRG